jgi:hypothetical protein
MKKSIKLFFPIATLIICCSCEGYKMANGFVKDQITNKPIDSVFVDVLSGSDEAYTDSLGYYTVGNEFGGCVPECKDIEIEYSKKGYQTLKRTNPDQNEIIYLSPK